MARYSRTTVDGVLVAIDADGHVGVCGYADDHPDRDAWLLSTGKVWRKGSRWFALPEGWETPCNVGTTRHEAISYLIYHTAWAPRFKRRGVVGLDYSAWRARSEPSPR